MPPRQAIVNAHVDLQRGWEVSDHPPSLEVFTEAVVRANGVRYTSAHSVVESVLAGRWP